MRGRKAKVLRRLALQMLQHGTTFSLPKPPAGQMLSTPVRYLYQALKGRNRVTIHT